MKKIVAFLLALVMLTSLTLIALAAGEKTGTTTLTAVVPEADYTIHVPANVTLEYGKTDEQMVGDYWVSDFVNMPIAAGEHEPFVNIKTVATCLSDGTNTIPVTYIFKLDGSWEHTLDHKVTNTSGEQITDMGITENYKSTIGAMISAEDWASAAPGTYTATITFNFSIYTGE